MTNNEIYGFKLIDKQFVKEVNADCLFFEHGQSGARLLKIAADDPNKTFCIAFKTLPESDNGVPHILEHSVLNGSAGFPVKSPFDILLKGSLHTFLNAMTGKDLTMYPVASMNEKDYFNLMYVYLDAVFNPLIYSDSRILKQEGWHYELEDKKLPVVYKGVVYNEMKGSFSNPVRELWYQVFKHLFPDTEYGFESGGTPAAIPTLTNEQFIAFHQKYYHPENSYIFLYGNGNLDKELEFLNNNYLSKYEKTGKRVIISDQKSFPAMKDITGYYSVVETENPENQTYISMNWVAGHGIDRALTLSLEILCELLVNQESAPIRLAMQKAGIGQDVSASADVYNQNVFQIVVQNANPEDKTRFIEIIAETLKKVVETGLDKNEVEGILNRMEFLLREGNDAQKGMTYIGQSLPGFFYADDPFAGLQYEKPLLEVKSALSTNYLEKIIRKYLLENTHSLLLSLEPNAGLETIIQAETERKLTEFKAGLSKEEIIKLVEQTQELVDYQKREETSEALATIPMLELQDIDTKTKWYQAEETFVEQVTLLIHEEFTNDVVYTSLLFDLRVLPQDLIPYAALLSNLIGLLDTESRSYGELNQLLNIHTGGFNVYLTNYLETLDDNSLIPKFVVSSKAMNTKLVNLFDLLSEIVNTTLFDDMERLQTLLSRHQSQLDASIKRAGNRYTATRLASYYSNQGMFKELTEGLSYYWFITDISKPGDIDFQSLIIKLKRVVSLLFSRNNIVATVTCGNKNKVGINYGFARLIQSLNEGKPAYNRWNFNLIKKNEGIATASSVQYVMMGYNFKRLGYKWDGKMRVLNQVLSTDWLQTRIRVIGGAYGGYCTVNPAGFFTFNSYRDPNLKETLQNYRKTYEYLENFEADKQAMTRYIIGAISSMDHPLTPSQKGDQAFNHYFSKRTVEDLQRDRDDVLATTAEDIRNYSTMIRDIIGQNFLCVYGNEDKINSEKDLFMALLTLGK